MMKFYCINEVAELLHVSRWTISLACKPDRRTGRAKLANHRLGKRIILRCPVIPGSNARPDHFAGVGRLAASLKRVEGIELIPHHNTAAQKYRNLGREYPVTTRPPTRDEMEEWKRIVSAHTDAPVSFPRLPL